MWFLLWSIHGLSLSLLRSGRVVLSDYHRDVCILCASGEWSFSFFPIPYACSFLLAPKDRRLALSWWSFSVPPMELFDGFSPFLYFLKDILSFDGPYDGPYSMVPSHEQHFLGSLHAWDILLQIIPLPCYVLTKDVNKPGQAELDHVQTQIMHLKLELRRVFSQDWQAHLKLGLIFSPNFII